VPSNHPPLTTGLYLFERGTRGKVASKAVAHFSHPG
jgi:hypothetical protein